MSKKSVLIVHNHYQIPGGEDTVVFNEKRLLESYGHKVILYTRTNQEINKMTLLKKVLMPFRAIYNAETVRDIKEIMAKEKIDIVHVHNTLSLISPSIYYIAIKKKIPVVQTIHNFRMVCPGATFYRKGKICEDCISKGLWCSVRNSCYRNSKLQTLICVINMLIHRKTGIYSKINYICLTEFNKKKLLSINSNSKKDIVCESNIYVKPNFTYYEDSETKASKDYFLFVGRLEKIKGISLLLEAFSRMPEKKVLIAGTGKELYENSYKDCKNIVFLGQLSKQEIDQVYQGAKALVVTAQTYEGFPMTFPEAFARGVPIIVGNMGNGGDLVEENVTGFHYTFDSVDSLIEVICKYDEMNYERLQKNAYEKYKNYYTPESNYTQLINIYDSILNKSRL